MVTTSGQFTGSWHLSFWGWRNLKLTAGQLPPPTPQVGMLCMRWCPQLFPPPSAPRPACSFCTGANMQWVLKPHLRALGLTINPWAQKGTTHAPQPCQAGTCGRACLAICRPTCCPLPHLCPQCSNLQSWNFPNLEDLSWFQAENVAMSRICLEDSRIFA